MLRCKPGDMARVVYARIPSSIGAIVEVCFKADGHPTGLPSWICKAAWPKRINATSKVCATGADDEVAK